MAYTLEVEQSLQTIDPSIAMPYWEYGMDPYLYENWWDSPIFDADWFGEANPSTSDHSIDDGGRWSGLKMPSAAKYSDWSIKDEGSLNPFTNAYGLMRGPWNNNPSMKLGRHNTTFGKSSYSTMPSCSSLQDCFLSTSFADVSFSSLSCVFLVNFQPVVVYTCAIMCALRTVQVPLRIIIYRNCLYFHYIYLPVKMSCC
jgi:hypothetical protein